MSQKCAFVVKKTINLPGCIRRIVAIRSREVTFPLYLSPARHIWNAGCCSGIPSTRQVWTYWRGSHWRVKMMMRLRHLTYGERLRELLIWWREGLGGISPRCIRTWYVYIRWVGRGRGEEVDLIRLLIKKKKKKSWNTSFNSKTYGSKEKKINDWVIIIKNNLESVNLFSDCFSTGYKLESSQPLGCYKLFTA